MKLSICPIPDVATRGSDWSSLDDRRIDGVVTRRIANVLTENGHLTEIWRSDWNLDDGAVDQVFQRAIAAGGVSAWHVHLLTVDRLFCATGDILVVLYDARVGSPTHDMITEHRFGEHDPMVLSIPPGVVHGVQATGGQSAVLVNAVDRAYSYSAPDHHRLPLDSPEIPYRF